MVGLILCEGAGMMDHLAAPKAVRRADQAAQRWQDLWFRAHKL